MGLITPKAKYGYIPGLDGMRAIAVLIVMISHVGISALIPGGFGVTVFFFISGFLITRLLLAEIDKDGRIGLKNFYIRRFLRLLPALYFMLIVTFICLTLLGARPSNGETLAAFTYTMNYYDLWLNSQGIAQTGPWGHLWSLAVEEHFYLLFPLLLIFFRRNLNLALKACGAIIIGALGWRLLHYYGLPSPEKYTYIATDARLDSIVFGCFFSLLMHLRPDSAWLKRVTGIAPLAFASVLILMSFLIRDDGFRETLRYSLQGLALLIFFRNLYFLPRLSWAPKVLDWKPVAWTGKISYGLYLWHIPVTMYFDQFTPLAFGSPAFVLAVFAATYVICWFSYHQVEKPVVELRRQYGSHIVKPPQSAVSA